MLFVIKELTVKKNKEVITIYDKYPVKCKPGKVWEHRGKALNLRLGNEEKLPVRSDVSAKTLRTYKN